MKLELYHRWGCPFSAKVRDFISDHKLESQIKMIEVDEVNGAIEKLVHLNGISQVPCLLIDGKPMLESDAIINFLDDNLLGSKNSQTL